MEYCGGFYCGSCGRTNVWMPPCTCTVEVEVAHVPAKCLRLRGGVSNSQEAGPSNIHDSDDDFDYSDMCSNASQAGEDEMLPADNLALMAETIEATERATNWAWHVVDQGGTLQHQQPSIPQLKQLSLDFMRTLSVPPNHPLDFSALVFEQIQQTLLIDLQTQIDVPYDKQVHKLTRGAYNHHWRSYLQDLHRNVRRLHFGASTNGISHQFRLVGYQLMYELCMLQTPLSRSQEAI